MTQSESSSLPTERHAHVPFAAPGVALPWAGLFEGLPYPAALVDADRRLERLNPAARDLFGEDAAGRGLAEVLPGRPDTPWPRPGEAPRAWLARHASGTLLPVELSVVDLGAGMTVACFPRTLAPQP
ncbi:MAG TPA: PAS domain-containing protein, partial [Acidimicrobiales bacterium]|nr:PAS domain-containing protein [Acidimicrobiales bacterium]